MRAYVYQGYYQAGGAYMAYHLGKVLCEHFGLEVFVVGDKPDAAMFVYPLDFPAISQDTLEKDATENDLLVCNPSFSGNMFGLRLPCKKLSYIQGIRTFSLLDVFFDHYVFVSHWARKHIHELYGITGNVIPAFIHTEWFNCAEDWTNRLDSVAIIERKCDELVLARFLEVFRSMYPACGVEFQRYARVSQRSLALLLKKHRYYLSLAVMEGFGLPMLEAMACGCAAVGWDAGGSSEYAVHGGNCLLSRYGDFSSLARNLYFVLQNRPEAERLAIAGSLTGERFSEKRFDAAWVSELSQFLDRNPSRLP